MECYCGYFIDGKQAPLPECRQNNTCTISDNSAGQCYLEKKTLSSGGPVTLKYSCFELLSSQINPSALERVCNKSTSTADNNVMVSSDIVCCSRTNFCNRDIQFVEHASSQSPTAPTSATSGKTTHKVV